jgi:hypothetical protein
MKTSASITNYENLGLYLTASLSTSKSASEKNGRAIRKTFTKPATKPQPVWEVEECVIQMRNETGSVKEIAGFEVHRGLITKRFITIESVQRFISKN